MTPPSPATSPGAAAGADVVVVSNRGPVNFGHHTDGRLRARRAAGGLVVVLGPGVQQARATWVAAALSEADRDAARRGGARGDQPGTVDAEGFHVRSLVIDPADFAAYYDVVANGTLWYLNHGLWDLARRPRFDRHWHRAWEAYRRVNARFAAAADASAAPGATVIVHDYHLALVAGMLAARRPDLRTASFVHTPWCTPDELAVLPDEVGAELISGLVRGGPCGFHSARWAARFAACAEAVTGTAAATFVAPAGTDVSDRRAVAAGAECEEARTGLDALLGDRRFVVRVDRIEPSKNILRGLWAFDALLESHPEWVGAVTFGVFVYPSRQALADYLAYGQEVTTLVDLLNAKWARPDTEPGWTPILLDAEDDFPRSVAALSRYDALLVNPVRDGFNLVAAEGPLVNGRDGVVVLSRQAGAHDQLAEHVLGVNPFDVAATADALARALALPAADRRDRAEGLRAAASRITPLGWWDQVLAGVTATTGRRA